LPVSSNQLPVNNGQLPVSSNQLPVNNGQLPVSNPQSPIPNPQPLTPTIGKLRTTATIGKPVVQVETAPVSQAQEPVIQQNKVFGISELQVAWDKLVQHLESKQRFSEFVILNRSFTLKGTTIHLEVDNEIQVDLLTTTLRTEVLNFLRKELQNSTIHLEVVVAEVESKPLIYTQAEKFKFLAEKNPALNDLKNALGLDYDY
jgi:DNA polymerase III subunit gamma/tau